MADVIINKVIVENYLTKLYDKGIIIGDKDPYKVILSEDNHIELSWENLIEHFSIQDNYVQLCSVYPLEDTTSTNGDSESDIEDTTENSENTTLADIVSVPMVKNTSTLNIFILDKLMSKPFYFNAGIGIKISDIPKVVLTDPKYTMYKKTGVLVEYNSTEYNKMTE